ncbi:MAG: hypothetical protein RIN56_13350 [Sporomusaceae bacterium]|nr:hypothetical protein [Sporomusaceae bacterium]
MATIEEKQIAKEILIELIRKNALDFEAFPGTKNYKDLSLLAYKDILKVVSESE